MPAIGQRASALQLLDDVTVLPELSVGIFRSVHGVAILAASGNNGPGTGRIRSNADGVAWRAPGSATYGPAVAVAVDGDVILEDGEERDKFVEITVTVRKLTAGVNERDVPIFDRVNLFGGPDVMLAGIGVETSQAFRLHNRSSAAIDDVRVWIDPAVVDLTISKGAGPKVTPTSEDDPNVLIWPLIGAGLTAVDNLNVWRTPTTPGPLPAILNLIHFGFNH